MRRARGSLALLLIAFLLLPAVAGAQAPPEPSRPPLPAPPPCGSGCWWPVGAVARLDVFEAAIDVADGVVEARYRLELSNPLPPGRGAAAEGRIVVPVPPGSSVTDLVLSGGPQTLEGRLLDADGAQRIYEEIVRRRIDPALLRSLGGDLYEVRAFPVPAGETRTVSFTVTTPLVADGGQAVIEVPWSRMSPRPLAALVTVEVDVPWEVRSAIAPGFDVDVDRHGDGRLSVSWESPAEWSAGANFRLYLVGGDGLVDARLLTHREPGEPGYFALLLAPAVEIDRAVARDVVLVLDTSGSMAGEKIVQARAAAAYILERTGEDDRFGIVSFARRVDQFGDGLHPASERDGGLDYVEHIRAGGGTNISGALERGLAMLSGERPGTLIFLTDGLPTAGVTGSEAILRLAEAAAPPRAQLFAFGVGNDVDTVLLDALTTRLAGTSHYVTPGERIDAEVGRLFERISTPVLTDVRISIDGSIGGSTGGSTGGVEAFDPAPREITGVFAGSQALLTGRYDGSGDATVTLSGNSFDGEEHFTYRVAFPAVDRADAAIAQLWAQRRVADLLTELRIEGARDALVEEIVEIATRFGIVTPYTSYLAEEPELLLSPRAAQDAVAEAAAAAPSGARAVAGAADLEKLREGALATGARTVRVVGAHSYYAIDGAWVRDGYDRDAPAPEVMVGSAEFASLIAAVPEAAAAAALGERVVVLGRDGWVTVVWPAASVSETLVPLPEVTPASGTGSSGGGGLSAGPTAVPALLPASQQTGEAAGGTSGAAAPLTAVVVALGLGLVAGGALLCRRRAARW